MDYEWDLEKAKANRRKHGIDFADATGVFADPLALSFHDIREGENRFVLIGTDFMNRILVVAYTWRGASIRIISARKATASERKQYEG